MAIPLDKWSFAHDGGRRYRTLTTNVSESINGVLKDARHLPVTATVMTTFFKLVEYFTDKASKATSKMESRQTYSNFAMNKYELWRQKARRHRVAVFDRVVGIYSVQTPVDSH
ncbi:hypothetical protein Vadar_027226 [Vaccinium darrowii]|uniref:Uncharacterized protein n=1 Tax=Vaccinium darrowii TaxID=229202 RepID=A0ACB7X4E2_9ERIC|nr:hypothetical protein Vadar_027226 [Vaccinium darrowii]